MSCANREVLLCDGQRESLALKLFLLNYGTCPQGHFLDARGHAGQTWQLSCIRKLFTDVFLKTFEAIK